MSGEPHHDAEDLSAEQPKEWSVFDVPEGNDWFLSYLVRWANDLGVEVGVSLTVGGTIVSGVLISGSTYFKEFAATYGGGFADTGLGNDMEGLIAQFADVYTLPEGREKLQGPPPAYVHLKEAKLFHPGQRPIPSNGPGVLWRGRISQVSGFSLGRLSAN